MENDDERENEFLFSTSSYDSLTELHIIENQTYIYEKTTNFMGKSIFSFQYSMVEVNKDNKIFYFIGFTHSSSESQNGDRLDIKKIGFNSFSLKDVKYYKNLTIDYNQDNRILNLFIIEDFEILVLVYIKILDNNPYLIFKYFDYDLVEQGSEQSLFKLTMETNGDNARDRNGIFFKSVELPDKKRAFALYDNGIGDHLYFRIYQFSKNENSYSASQILSRDSRENGKEYRFSSYVTFNDIYKLNNERIAVVSVAIAKNELVLLLYDLYNNYQNVKMRWYLISISNLGLKKELSLYSFNDYLMLSITGSSFADLIIFGYANGTDSIIDISPYLSDSLNYKEDLNLITELYNNITIDNNIFGYIQMSQMKIVSIPEGIIFYKKEGGTNVQIQNGTIIDKDINYILKQNKEIIKTNEYYDLYYQHMVTESSYDNLYTNSHFVFDYSENNNDYNNYKNDFKVNEFYGRTSKLTFKLCHDYCNTCKEIGNDINNQKCVSCLDSYTYDYWNYYNYTYSSNCVPLDYMNIIENNIIVKCNTQERYKYYYNKTKKAKICFRYEYNCPKEYSYFNETNNECTDYSPPVPSTIPIEIEKLTTEEPNEEPEEESIETFLAELVVESTEEKIEESIEESAEESTKEITKESTEELKEESKEELKEESKEKSNEESTEESSEESIKENKKESVEISIEHSTEKSLVKSTEELIKETTEEPLEESTEQSVKESTSKTEEIITSNFISESTDTITIPNTSGICSYNIFLNTTCSFNELNQEESYNKIKQEIITTFPSDGQSISIDTKNGYSFQVTTSKSVIDYLQIKNGLSLLELGDCETILKEKNNIDESTSLIILTYEKKSGSSNEKDIQYEIIDPNTHNKLDLSVCENNDINIYVPINLNEKEKQLYQEVNEQEYDLLDLNGKFYTDICTPFTSDRNTDILLNDRINYYYSKIINETTCPNNCDLLLYIANNNILKCKCEINNEKINTNINSNLNNIVYNYFSFLNDYKYRSYKTMKCYKLVFDSKIFGKNAGSILVLLFFIAYLAFMGLYIYKNISPLKTIISKIVMNKEKNSDKNLINALEIQTKTVKKKRIQNIKREEENNANPPKNGEKDNNNDIKEVENDNDIEVVKYNKNKENLFEVHSLKSGNSIKQKPNKDNFEINMETENVLNTNSKNAIAEEENKNKKSDEIREKEKSNLSNYELNKLEYEDALILDKRNYLTIYLSHLKREQLIWFTFISWNDYNLFYVKIARFIFLLCTEMTMNALLFADKTIHKYYIENGKYNFGQSLPHIIYSILITHALEVLLCYLSMTDIHIYEIKGLKKNEQTTENIYNILKMIRIKLIIFFSFTGLVFLFYWYCVSAFCAVYQKTQGFFILNSFLSFLFELIDPFIFYALFTLLRTLSFKYKNLKGMKLVYKSVKIFPIF